MAGRIPENIPEFMAEFQQKVQTRQNLVTPLLRHVQRARTALFSLSVAKHTLPPWTKVGGAVTE